LDEVRKTSFAVKSEGLSVVRDSETSTDARLQPHYREKQVERTPCSDSTEKPLVENRGVKTQLCVDDYRYEVVRFGLGAMNSWS